MPLYPVCFTSPLATVMVPCSRPCTSQACPWMQHSGGSCLVPAYRCSGERSGQHPPTLLLCLANTIQKCTLAMCASRSGTPGQRLTPTSHCSPLARTTPTEHYSYLTRSERKRERERKRCGMAVGGASTVAPDRPCQPTHGRDRPKDSTPGSGSEPMATAGLAVRGQSGTYIPPLKPFRNVYFTSCRCCWCWCWCWCSTQHEKDGGG
ncbi:hypothetical protein K456DRAFT_1189387 [Colletotrichum gloeosporioides 23]|nr:hypothetical protein K456DRAFT_1189387 [Colletotrichum gloeosporioides 23]